MAKAISHGPGIFFSSQQLLALVHTKNCCKNTEQNSANVLAFSSALKSGVLTEMFPRRIRTLPQYCAIVAFAHYELN